jgi:hypothetical protein
MWFGAAHLQAEMMSDSPDQQKAFPPADDPPPRDVRGTDTTLALAIQERNNLRNLRFFLPCYGVKAGRVVIQIHVCFCLFRGPAGEAVQDVDRFQDQSARHDEAMLARLDVTSLGQTTFKCEQGSR